MVASENAYFEIPPKKLGLLYNPVSMKQLHARFGSGILTRLFLLGERCNAHTLFPKRHGGRNCSGYKSIPKGILKIPKILRYREVFPPQNH
ncbi:MAG: hypothetical protein Ct9H300mP23_08260 [Nitrospinota bacterium]|nr:MAG: hypothetical protein Ct9H300mP23_08260 [Nitrospinota bacterium]